MNEVKIKTRTECSITERSDLFSFMQCKNVVIERNKNKKAAFSRWFVLIYWFPEVLSSLGSGIRHFQNGIFEDVGLGWDKMRPEINILRVSAADRCPFSFFFV